MIDELNLTIINCYRSPGGKAHHFAEMLDIILEWCENIKSDIALLGDFNLGGMKDWNPERIESLRRRGAKPAETHGKTFKMELRFLDFADSNFISQIVTEPTWEQNILDLIFTNSSRRRDIEVVKNVNLSDHNSIRFRIVMDKVTKTNANEDKKLNTTDIRKYKIDDLNNEGWSKINTSLRNTDWIYGVAIFTGHQTKVMMNST